MCLIWHGAALESGIKHSPRDGNEQPPAVKPGFGKLKCKLFIPAIPVWPHRVSYRFEELEYYGFYIGIKELRHKYHYCVSGWLENSTAVS